MTTEEIDKTLQDLKEWVDSKHGRGLRVAKYLGVSAQLLSTWLSDKDKRGVLPKLKTWVKIKEFLKKSEKERNKAIEPFDNTTKGS